MEEELAKKQAKVDKYRKGNKKNEDNGEHPKKIVLHFGRNK